jgi:hypothetical protein
MLSVVYRRSDAWCMCSWTEPAPLTHVSACYLKTFEFHTPMADRSHRRVLSRTDQVSIAKVTWLPWGGRVKGWES